jgi:hypothetical protein
MTAPCSQRHADTHDGVGDARTGHGRCWCARACPTWSTASSSRTGGTQSKGADHLRPRGRRRLHPPHRRPAHARPHHHPGQHTARRRSIHRARLERQPARRLRKSPPPAAACTTTSSRKPKSSADRAQGHPSAPVPASGSLIHAQFPGPAARSCRRMPERSQRQGRAAGPPAGCPDAGEHRRAPVQQVRRSACRSDLSDTEKDERSQID